MCLTYGFRDLCQRPVTAASLLFQLFYVHDLVLTHGETHVCGAALKANCKKVPIGAA